MVERLLAVISTTPLSRTLPPQFTAKSEMNPERATWGSVPFLGLSRRRKRGILAAFGASMTLLRP
jgi:hypothetical protein